MKAFSITYITAQNWHLFFCTGDHKTIFAQASGLIERTGLKDHHAPCQDYSRQYHELTYTSYGQDPDGSFLIIPYSELLFIYLQLRGSGLTCTLARTRFLYDLEAGDVIGPIHHKLAQVLH